MEAATVEYVKIAGYIASAFVLAIGTIGPALAQGMIASKACENFGKYPESQTKLRNVMLMGLAFTESGLVYCLLISGVILYLVS